jgi:hypothetical protein
MGATPAGIGRAAKRRTLRGGGRLSMLGCIAMMRWLRIAVGILALTVGNARAFHDGGVGSCDGCHSMHGPAGSRTPGTSLLTSSDASSTCLGCHGGKTSGGYLVMTTSAVPGIPPLQYTPGGDFGWLLKSYTWLDGTGIQTSKGEHHGHSIAAADYGLFPDSTRASAPGGTYPSDKLTCISCHDPHGRYRMNADGSVKATGGAIVGSGSYGAGSLLKPSGASSVGVYRLLGGSGWAPKSAGQVVPFSAQPPVALAPPQYNRPEGTSDTRVAYGTGMSEWCGNCHGAIHTTTQSNTTSTFVHPAGAAARLVLGGESAIYNQYVTSGTLSGSSGTSYTSLVPYEEGTTDRDALARHATSDGSFTNGPTSGLEVVSCLSCHRAHASGWDGALRWNPTKSGIIVVGGQWPGIDASGSASLGPNAQGRTQAETRAAMYDRDPAAFAAFQRVLCNKCHGQG